MTKNGEIFLNFPVVIVGKIENLRTKKKTNISANKHVMLLWCHMSTFRKYIALIYPISKTLKIFEFQKSRFFHWSWKNRFLLKTKNPNKKRSADSKSALNSEFNDVPHYIWVLSSTWGAKYPLQKNHFFTLVRKIHVSLKKAIK